MIDAAQRLAQLQRVFLSFGSVILVLLGFVATRIVLVIPHFERTFSEMLGDKPLPVVTTLSIGMARLGGGLVPFLFTAALPLATLVLLLMRPDHPRVWWTTLGVCTLLLLFIAAVPASLALPLITILTELNAP